MFIILRGKGCTLFVLFIPSYFITLLTYKVSVTGTYSFTVYWLSCLFSVFFSNGISVVIFVSKAILRYSFRTCMYMCDLSEVIMFSFSQISTEDNMNYAAIIEGINSVSRYGTAGGFLCFLLPFLVLCVFKLSCLLSRKECQGFTLHPARSSAKLHWKILYL